MSELSTLQILGAFFAFLTGVGFVGLFFKPTVRLSSRIRPYTTGARSALGKAPDVFDFGDRSNALPATPLERLLRPLIELIVRVMSSRLGHAGEASLLLKLRQADQLRDVPEDHRVHEFRVRQVGGGVIGALAGAGPAVMLGGSAGIVLLLATLGLVIGVTRRTARLGATIEARRTRMRIELYTVNQQLAMHLRTGGSPVQAMQRMVRRGNGEIVDELRDVLRQHSRGMPASKALARAAELTPEPYAARTYKLLASGAERGADLAGALLALSEDMREARREALRRAATTRRAQMLIPIILLLAPLMMLFLIAPLPKFLFNIE